MVDISGRIVFIKPLLNELESIDVSGLKSGIYILKFVDRGIVHTNKVIVQ